MTVSGKNTYKITFKVLKVYILLTIKDGFRMEDIRYKWAEGLNKSALDVAPNIELPQLIYRDFKLIERQFRLSTGTNN